VRSGQTTSFLLAEFVKALGMFAHFLVCARVTGVGLVIFVRALGLIVCVLLQVRAGIVL
jgi:hypothetical protein